MVCPFCGKENTDGTKQCVHCNGILKKPSPLFRHIDEKINFLTILGFITVVGILCSLIVARLENTVIGVSVGVLFLALFILSILDSRRSPRLKASSAAGGCLIYFVAFVASFIVILLIGPLGINVYLFLAVGVYLGFVFLFFSKSVYGKANAVGLILLSFLSPGFFHSFMLIDYISEGAQRYNACIRSLDELKKTEGKYFVVNRKYTENPDHLASYLFKECEQPEGNDCPGRVKEKVSKDCSDFRIELMATSTIKITGRARDEFNCFVCDPPKDVHEIGPWECPTKTPEDCH